MKFCVYCGAQLEDNATCTCQGAQMAANQQAQLAQQVQQAPPQNPAPYNPPYSPPAYAQPSYTPPQAPYAPVTPPSQPGRKMIKVAGILMTILGGMAFFSIVVFLLIAPSVMEMIDDLGYFFEDVYGMYDFYSIETLFVSMLSGLISSGIMLAFGIIGIIFSKSPAKGTAVMVLGIIQLVLSVIGSFVNNGVNGLAIMSLFTSSVLPILYIVGGNIRRKSAN
jgi:hypothetical protein